MIKILTGPVHFLGQVEFKVLSGSVRVNGKIFKDSEWTPVYSPKSTALLAFEPEHEAQVEFRPVVNGLEGIQACQPTFANLFTPDQENSEWFEEVVEGGFLMRAGGEEFFPVLRIGEEWKGVLDSITIASSGRKVIFVCGHRKVGKSSFSRFLLNGLLNENEAVDFVDLDPGQTEFTPAGYVAKKTFKQSDALLGPPFSHLQVPDDGIYLASSNGSEMPLLYCRAIKSIASKMSADPERPVVINTMGWMTGLGLELIQCALQAFKPSHVLAFMAPESDDLIRKCLMTNSFGTRGALSEEEATGVQIRYMGNPVGEGPRSKHSPADQRSLAYWAYFFGTINPCGLIDKYNFKQLSAVRPVVVPLSHVQLACTSREIDLFDLVKTRDGCDQVRLLESWLLMRVVGIARDDQFNGAGSRWVNLLSNGKVGRVGEMPCVGLGLIRAVARVSETRVHLHIITPLPLHTLSTTNTLILGSQHLPLPLLSADQMSMRGEGAGVSTQIVGTDVNGSSARKTRHNMRRR